VLTEEINVAVGDGGDPCKWRNFLGEALQKFLNFLKRAFNFDAYAGGSISDKPRKGALIGEAIDEGAKANALDDAGNVDGFAERGHGRLSIILEWRDELGGQR